MKRFLLADHHPALRSALALLLEVRAGAQIVGQVNSMESLLYEAEATYPDWIILEWTLPGKPCEGRIAALRAKSPRSKIVVTGVQPEIAAQTADADAFFCETDYPESLLGLLKEKESHV